MINRGLILAIVSALSFSIMNVMVKGLSVSMGTGEIVFGRSLVGVILILLIMKKYDIKFSNKDIGALIFRGIVGGTSMFLFFVAISGMNLGDVAILQQLSAIFVVFLSAVWLKEKVPLKAVPPLGIIIMGAVLLIRPWEYHTFSFYAWLVILGAFLTALAYTTISKLFKSGGHNSWEIVFYFLFCSMLIGLVTMKQDYHCPDMNELMLIVGIGIMSLAAQALMTQAYGMANAVTVSFVLYIGIFFNALWGYVLFDEKLGALSIVGGILIVGGSMYLTLVKQKNRANKEKQPYRKEEKIAGEE